MAAGVAAKIGEMAVNMLEVGLTIDIAAHLRASKEISGTLKRV
jgi:hypothetical protein